MRGSEKDGKSEKFFGNLLKKAKCFTFFGKSEKRFTFFVK
jgi:hypothetical protein